MAQLLLMCDAHDIGISISGFEIRDSGFARDARQADPRSHIPNPEPVQMFVYDNYPGGIGFSEPLFRMHDELLAATRQLIAECECENGCPGCVGPVGNTGPLAKAAAAKDSRPAHRRGAGTLAWPTRRFSRLDAC